MAAFDDLKHMSFAGIPFPVKSVRISGGIRDHVHEYPHSPGGAPEKLGRKLYEISAEAVFLQGLINPLWGSLWPQNLSTLRKLWEDQATRDLHIPTIGTIQAYAFNWEQVMDARIRSGEMVSLRFREDQTAAFLTQSLIQTTARSFVDRAADFQIAADELDPKPSIFDAIQDAANSVLAFKDQADLYGNLVEAKLLGLTALLQAADRQVLELNDPVNHRLLDAMLGLWEAAVKLQQDLEETGAKLQEFVVPIQMSTSQAAASIFNDASRGGDILSLNALTDPFAIPAGTVLKYYADAA